MFSNETQGQYLYSPPPGGLFSEQTHVCALVYLEPGMKLMAKLEWVSLCILLADGRYNYVVGSGTARSIVFSCWCCLILRSFTWGLELVDITAKVSLCGSTGVNLSLALFPCSSVHLTLLQGQTTWSLGLWNQRQPDALVGENCISSWIRKLLCQSTLEQLCLSLEENHDLLLVWEPRVLLAAVVGASTGKLHAVLKKLQHNVWNCMVLNCVTP